MTHVQMPATQVVPLDAQQITAQVDVPQDAVVDAKPDAADAAILVLVPGVVGSVRAVVILAQVPDALALA